MEIRKLKCFVNAVSASFASLSNLPAVSAFSFSTCLKVTLINKLQTIACSLIPNL
jgi:hypothetical protein